jgi:hypothetical protein
MSLKLYIQQGQEGNAVAELTDSLPVIEGSNTPLVRMGMHYGDGDSGQSTFTLMERTGTELAPGHRPSGRRLTTLVEDVTGCERWIHRGRINSGVFGKGARPGGNNAELENTSFDGNMELRGQAFTEDWVRPAETDYERLVALQAYILNGPDSTSPVPGGDTHGSRASCRVVVDDSHLCKNAHTVTMPAATYPIGTQPVDVVSDCATTAGKDYGVVIHEGGFPSLATATISDHTSEAAFDSGTDIVVPSGLSNSALVAFVTTNGSCSGVKYIPDPGAHPGVGPSFTQISGTATGHGCEVTAWQLVSPAASVGTGRILSSNPGSSGPTGCAVYLLEDVNQSSPIAASAAASTTSNGDPTVGTSISGTGKLVLSAIGFVEKWDQTCDGTADSPQTLDETAIGTSGFGNPGASVQSAHASDVTSVGWSSLPDTSCGAAPNWPLQATGLVAVAVNGLAGTSEDCDHLCLQYIVPTDASTNPCTVKISDIESDYDPLGSPPTMFPIPDQGKYTNGDAGELLSAVAYVYQTPLGSGVAFSEDAPTTDAYDYWRETVTDSLSLTPTQAELRADAYRNSKLLTHVSSALSIFVNPDQVHLVRAGMAIQVKGRRIYGLDYLGTYQTRRIADVIAQPEIDDGSYHYRLTLQLDRSQRKVPGTGSFGSAPGDPNRSTVVTGGGTGSGGTQTIQNAITGLEGAPTRTRALTNKSGGSVVAGDVVIVDTANDDAFTTTNTAGVTKVVGVAQETIASNAVGLVALEGYVALVNVTASVTRGHYGATGTTVKKATGASARAAGSFCQFLKAGTSPDAILFGVPDTGGGSGATFGTPAIVLGTAAAAGSIDEVIRRDSTIVAFDATAPTTQAIGDTAATGSAAVAARRDHLHGEPSFAGTGSASTIAHSDHTHTGGGGGSVTDAILGQSGVGGATITGLQGSPDIVAGGGSDHEFDSTTIGGSNLGSPDTIDANTTALSHLYIKKGASNNENIYGRYWSWTPSNGQILTAKLAGETVRNQFNMVGLGVAEASPGKVEGIMFSHINAYGTIYHTQWSSPTGSTTTVTSNAFGDQLPRYSPIYFKITYNSSTSLDFAFSYSGLPGTWLSVTSARNPGFTVGAFALFLMVNNAGADLEALFDWVRVA